MRILIFGITGMLGHTLFYELNKAGLDVHGTVRKLDTLKDYFPPNTQDRLINGVDVYNFPSIVDAVNLINPNIIINCIGLIRQLPEGKQPLPCLEINARFPHLLFMLCKEKNIRLIHYSTDCVFDGKKGAPYTEFDPTSAKDIYGLTKYIGELNEAPAITIRTSIIGHELKGKKGLLEWFLFQESTVKGYRKVLFTGLPTDEHARILVNNILPNPALHGLYHVSSQPISKYDLLRLFAKEYDKTINIEPDDEIDEDRRLDSHAFTAATGYCAPSWPDLVANMRKNYFKQVGP
jgi:dTDP-4-dehydrorhamnose reductase